MNTKTSKTRITLTCDEHTKALLVAAGNATSYVSELVRHRHRQWLRALDVLGRQDGLDLGMPMADALGLITARWDPAMGSLGQFAALLDDLPGLGKLPSEDVYDALGVLASECAMGNDACRRAIAALTA